MHKKPNMLIDWEGNSTATLAAAALAMAQTLARD